jgi:hypothetical protein
MLGNAIFRLVDWIGLDNCGLILFAAVYGLFMLTAALERSDGSGQR